MSRNPNILLWNAGSLASRKNELIHVLRLHKIHIALITESWLTPSSVFSLPNYNTHREDRTKGPRGGVIILIHHSLKFLPLKIRYFDNFETAFVKILTLSLFVGTVCNPPNNILNSKDLDIITGISYPLIVGGDFNARHSIWNNITNNCSGITLFSHSQRGSYEIVNPNEFTFHNNHHCHPSTLDIFLVNHPNLSKNYLKKSSANFLFAKVKLYLLLLMVEAI